MIGLSVSFVLLPLYTRWPGVEEQPSCRRISVILNGEYFVSMPGDNEIKKRNPGGRIKNRKSDCTEMCRHCTRLESFYLPKMGGSCCLSGSKCNRPPYTIMSRLIHTYDHKWFIITFANLFKLGSRCCFLYMIKDNKCLNSKPFLICVNVLCLSTPIMGTSFPFSIAKLIGIFLATTESL